MSLTYVITNKKVFQQNRLLSTYFRNAVCNIVEEICRKFDVYWGVLIDFYALEIMYIGSLVGVRDLKKKEISIKV